jgi:hypothetical protein
VQAVKVTDCGDARDIRIIGPVLRWDIAQVSIRDGYAV